MSEKEKFKQLLKGAAKSARRKAARKKLPVAISINGKIYLVYPGKELVKATREQIQQLSK